MMNMSHENLKDNIFKYLTGELEGEDLITFEIHMIECSECKNIVLLNSSIFSIVKEHIRKSTIGDLEELFISSRSIIDKLNKLKTFFVNSISFNVLCIDAVRSPEDHENIHMVDDKILFSIDIPKSGTLCVFHYDFQNNIRIVFPSGEKDEASVNAGENMPFPITISKPIGKQWIQAILVFDELTLPSAEEYNNFNFANCLLDSAEKMNLDAWMESIYEFEVIEKQDF